MTEHLDQTVSPFRAPQEIGVRKALRSLYALRAVFCVVWLILLLVSSAGLTMADRPSIPVAILFVVYPAWDVVGTVFDIRAAGGAQARALQRVNVVISAVATVVMIVALLSTIGAGVLVFGTWAVLAGLVTLVVAIRRLRLVGGQWPMLISGGLALFIGSGFVTQSGDAAASPAVLVSYVAGGAVWFLLAALTLTRTLRAGTGTAVAH